jgi:hypothetical protein
MLIHSFSKVRLREDDTRAPLSQHTPLIACLFAHGWRLCQDGSCNAWHELSGPLHVNDCKNFPTRKLTRHYILRFWAVSKDLPFTADGKEFRVEQFVAQYLADPAFRRAAQAHPRYTHWLAITARELPRLFPRYNVKAPHDHNRSLAFDVRKWTPAQLTHYGQQYEDGFTT